MNSPVSAPAFEGPALCFQNNSFGIAESFERNCWLIQHLRSTVHLYCHPSEAFASTFDAYSSIYLIKSSSSVIAFENKSSPPFSPPNVEADDHDLHRQHPYVINQFSSSSMLSASI
ncbi:hypothetical protein V6N11_068062 [Hibiscus sabdariffa]|uniref:Uncharacterized protein n=1 Tax=Hibiscus sabdariffa TaxID=183260 RepID=A0ABR2STH4_9ROSI